jgi:hypothetical protein
MLTDTQDVHVKLFSTNLQTNFMPHCKLCNIAMYDANHQNTPNGVIEASCLTVLSNMCVHTFAILSQQVYYAKKDSRTIS